MKCSRIGVKAANWAAILVKLDSIVASCIEVLVTASADELTLEAFVISECDESLEVHDGKLNTILSY